MRNCVLSPLSAHRDACSHNYYQNSTQDLAENSMTFESAFNPFTNVNPMHVVVLLAIAVFAAFYHVLKLRKDTYRLLEENKQPTPDSASQ